MGEVPDAHILSQIQRERLTGVGVGKCDPIRGGPPTAQWPALNIARGASSGGAESRSYTDIRRHRR